MGIGKAEGFSDGMIAGATIGVALGYKIFHRTPGSSEPAES